MMERSIIWLVAAGMNTPATATSSAAIGTAGRIHLPRGTPRALHPLAPPPPPGHVVCRNRDGGADPFAAGHHVDLHRLAVPRHLLEEARRRIGHFLDRRTRIGLRPEPGSGE